MELTHTCDNGLTCLFRSIGSEGGVFFCQLSQRDTHLLLTCLSLRLDSELDNRLREFHGFQNNRVLLVAESITCCSILQTDSCTDITSVDGIDILSVVGVHLNDTSDSLVLILSGVVNGRTCAQHAGVYSEVCQLTNEGVCSDLECQCCERLIVAGNSLALLTCIRVNTLDVGNVDRRRHIVNDSVEQLLYALILVGSTTSNRNHCVSDGGLSDNSLHLFDGDLLISEELLSQIVINFCEVLDQVSSVLLCLFLHILGDIFTSDILAQIIIINVRLHLKEIDDTLEIFLSADRQLDRNGIALKSLVEHIQYVIEISTHDIHLVDVYHTRYLIVISLSPNSLGLGLNAALCTKNGNRAVENSQRSFNFNGEVNVAGSIYNVESVTLPVASSSSRGDSDTSLLLLCHPVHCRCTVVCFTDLIVNTGIEQDTLSSSCLTGVDVCHDTDITVILELSFSSHDISSSILLPSVMSESLVSFSHLVCVVTLLA